MVIDIDLTREMIGLSPRIETYSNQLHSKADIGFCPFESTFSHNDSCTSETVTLHHLNDVRFLENRRSPDFPVAGDPSSLEYLTILLEASSRIGQTREAASDRQMEFKSHGRSGFHGDPMGGEVRISV
jgi:hypothetical protein